MQPIVEVRDSVLEDFQEIMRIRMHPLVRPHQFRILPEYEDGWKWWIENNAPVGDLWFRSSTIIGDRRVIGYISQTLYFRGESPFAECAWNLDPDYWAKGIMKNALREILRKLFAEQDMSYVVADCFRTNTRCKRLLCNLHFSRIGVAAFERIRMAYEFQCLHWVERYRIDRLTWNRTPQNLQAQ